MYQSLFLNKVAGLPLLKKRLLHRCSPVKIAKFLRTPFFRTTASDTKQTSTVATTEFLSKIPNRKKIFNQPFNLCEAEISLDEIIKFINSKTNNESPGSVGLTAEFYKQFSNELAPALLDVYDSWGKLGTMGVTSRTGIISVKYKKGDKKDIANYRTIYYNS